VASQGRSLVFEDRGITPGMRVSHFDYELPPELIAQAPAATREAARLLLVPPDGEPHHTVTGALADHVREGTLVVVNDTRVLPARILGAKADTGGRTEILLVRKVGELDDGSVRWRAMARASKALRPGMRVVKDALEVTIEDKSGDGLFGVRLATRDGSDLGRALEAAGQVPLPPYIKRAPQPADVHRYQTVFARVPGAVAAPTAGLHLGEEILGRLRACGCEIATCTLHVGLGTFQPVTVEDLDEHPMHAEWFEVSTELATAIERARARSAEVLAIGTTVVRALESAAHPERAGHVLPSSGETRLLIQPGFRFRVVDRLLTNFHLPRSTLLALVSAFAGTDRVLDAYRLAVRERYRFFSYGDAMLLDRDRTASVTS
jgi:S-adenosylmethionine:tRNA ribosyltransferase-isomerase